MLFPQNIATNAIIKSNIPHEKDGSNKKEIKKKSSGKEGKSMLSIKKMKNNAVRNPFNPKLLKKFIMLSPIILHSFFNQNLIFLHFYF